MVGHATNNEANQALYGLLHTALKQECFNDNHKVNMMSWTNKLEKCYENVSNPRANDRRR